MRRMKKRTALLAAVVLSCAGIAGCSGRDRQPAEPAGTEAGLEPVQSAGTNGGGIYVSDAEPEAKISEKETHVTRETAYQAVDETVYLTGDRVNVRSYGSTSAPVIAQLNRGAAVRRTGVGGGWSRVELNGQECYISSQYLTAALAQPAVPAQPAAGGQAQQTGTASQAAAGEVYLNPEWQYAGMAKITSGAARLYKAEENRKDIVVCVNAGHGTQGGSSVKTLCHPDGTPKVTGGTTAAGATTAVAVSSGMTFADGTPEHQVTLALALQLKEKLLAAGYDVLMIRETEDVQLDNVARTVIANNAADCHISLHWDSTTSDKGAFYMSVPSNESYRNMEPVRSHWQQHNALGESLVSGLRSVGVKIFSGGSMEMDLTQTSYSTVPSIDIELGDKVSDHSAAALDNLANGLLAGINQYFGQ